MDGQPPEYVEIRRKRAAPNANASDDQKARSESKLVNIAVVGCYTNDDGQLVPWSNHRLLHDTCLTHERILFDTQKTLAKIDSTVSDKSKMKIQPDMSSLSEQCNSLLGSMSTMSGVHIALRRLEEDISAVWEAFTQKALEANPAAAFDAVEKCEKQVLQFRSFYSYFYFIFIFNPNLIVSIVLNSVEFNSRSLIYFFNFNFVSGPTKSPHHS